MDSIILAFKVVFPIFTYIIIGYILKIKNFFDEKSLVVINNLVFKLFLPCMLFYNIYNTEISEVLNIRLIGFSVAFILLVFAALMIISPYFIKDGSKCGVFIQGSFRSNFVLFGLPVTLSLLGEGKGGLTIVAIAIVIPLYNILAVICLERFRNGKTDIVSLFNGIIKNPLIIASLLGFIFLLFNIRLPDFCDTTIKNLSNVATPLSLIGLGGTFTFSSLGENAKILIAIICIKMLVLPITALTIGAYFFGITGAPFVTLISIFTSPTAVSSFTMAQAMGGDSNIAAQTVVLTTLFSVFSVFMFVAVSKSLLLF